MEEEIGSLQKRLEERNAQLQASATTAEKVPLIYHSFLILFLLALTF